MGTLPTSLENIEPRPIKVRRESNLLRSDEERLTHKQALFIEYFYQEKSAYKAAIRAGYSPYTAKSASISILQSGPVIREMRRRRDEVFEKLKIDTNWIIQEAALLAGANMFDYIEVEDDGRIQVNLKNVNRDMGAAIQEFSYDIQGRPRIRLADKKASVELLAKLIIKDKTGFGAGVDSEGQPLTIQSLDAIVKQVQSVTINNNQINIVQPLERQELPTGMNTIDSHLIGSD